MGNPFQRPAIVSGQMSAPNGGSSLTPSAATGTTPFSAGFQAVGNATDDVMAGRVTLGMLVLIVGGLAVFFYVTRSVQGGT